MRPALTIASAAAVMLALALPAAPALAVRPTEGGQFSFDASDVVESWDEPTGQVRVHYSVDGPSVTHLDDDDGDGVPDFAQDVATTTVEVLELYEALGLRRPVSEEEMGLGDLGGSGALDVYLVDFDGMGDGAFGIDDCSSVPYHCSGYLMVENDFYGYGYWDLDEAVDILASHELFHGVQNAYDAGQEVWFAEGTAVWGERQFLGDINDFIWFADSYLEDTARSLDKPPSGPVPSWAYGTCLWWDFLTTRFDAELMADLLEMTEREDSEGVDTIAEMEALLAARGDDIDEAWFTFATWNLATGDRAGVMDSYGYADRLDGITADAEGSSLDDAERFYPLAANYYRIEHAGGPLWFGIEEPAPELVFALHPVEGGADDGPVGEALDTWIPDEAAAWALADGQDLPAGGYWIIGSQPRQSDGSVRVRICVGDEATATACAPAAADDDDDTVDDDDSADDDDGCACTSGGASSSPAPWLILGLLAALAGRVRHR